VGLFLRCYGIGRLCYLNPGFSPDGALLPSLKPTDRISNLCGPVACPFFAFLAKSVWSCPTGGRCKETLAPPSRFALSQSLRIGLLPKYHQARDCAFFLLFYVLRFFLFPRRVFMHGVWAWLCVLVALITPRPMPPPLRPAHHGPQGSEPQ